jgi:hypothetical protein
MDQMYDKLRRAAEARQLEAPARKQRLAEKSKENLQETIERNFKTTFIGNISAIEESGFGKLWGHGKRNIDRTAEERKWFAIWQELRAKILDNGNNQARAVLNELKQYFVNWQGYKLDLLVKDKE